MYHLSKTVEHEDNPHLCRAVQRFGLVLVFGFVQFQAHELTSIFHAFHAYAAICCSVW